MGRVAVAGWEERKKVVDRVESHLRGHAKNVPSEYIEYTLCREMRWTYTELYDQPTEMVELTMAFINAERKAQGRANKKAQRKTKGGAGR